MIGTARRSLALRPAGRAAQSDRLAHGQGADLRIADATWPFTRCDGATLAPDYPY